MSKNSFDLAIKKLGARDRTEKEIREYLLSKDFLDDEIAETIIELKEYGYINHRRYIQNYLDYGFSKKWGIIKIKINLKNLGILENEIEDGLYEYEEENCVDIQELVFENGLRLAKTYLVENDKPSEKILSKIGRRLTSMGYESSMIYKIIGIFMKD